MLLELKCPSCGYTQRTSDAVLGRTVLCPSCGGAFPVARPPSAAAPALPPRPRPAAPPPLSSSASASSPAASSSAPSRALGFPGPPTAADPSGRSSATRKAPAGGGGLPAWAHAALGGAGMLGLIALAVLFRSMVASGPSHPAGPGIWPEPGPRPAPDRIAAGNPAPPAAPIAEAPPSPEREPAPAAPLSTAQIVARCERSVALVKGRVSSGTGFLVRPGLIATNAHVIDDEFIDELEVRFPSAPAGEQGPARAELLDEDPRRDLAFLRIASKLPALEVARSYRFLKGEDIIVIGNPGLGDEVVLENAISRGVMSSKTTIDGQVYLQMGIAINPGNSGGPVFDSAGRVIGVATLKSSKAESMGFCIPVEDVNDALGRLDREPEALRQATLSRHRARTAFKLLTSAGALYASALNVRAGVLARLPALGPGVDLLASDAARTLDQVLSHLEERQLADFGRVLAELDADTGLAEPVRRRFDEIAANHRALRDLYRNPSQPAGEYARRAGVLRARHLQLVKALQADLGFVVPDELLAMLEAGPESDTSAGALVQAGPGQSRPRLRPFRLIPPPPMPMGPPFGSEMFKPAQDARERARALHRQLQDRMEERRRALEERIGAGAPS